MYLQMGFIKLYFHRITADSVTQCGGNAIVHPSKIARQGHSIVVFQPIHKLNFNTIRNIPEKYQC